METIKKQSFEKRKGMLWAETGIASKETVSASPLNNPVVLSGICSNCLNNGNCVWMENKKTVCEEYN